MKAGLWGLSILTVLAIAPNWAAAQSKCDAGKRKEYGKKVACLARVDAKADRKATPIDVTKQQMCVDKFVEKCAKAETNGDCTTAVQSCAQLAIEAETCRDAAQGCENGDGQCPAGCALGNDDDCSSCFLDLGLTVLDTCTNLEWEKKNTPVGSGANPGNLQDVDNRIAFAGCCNGTCTVPTSYCQPNATAAATCAALSDDGVGCTMCPSGTCDVDPFDLGTITTVWDWLNQLNAAGFAGHNDWRLPSEAGCSSSWTPATCTNDPRELEKILTSPCGTPPCIDPIFGPTSANNYWSGSSTAPMFANQIWQVNFQTSSAVHNPLSYGDSVRAVRPGS